MDQSNNSTHFYLSEPVSLVWLLSTLWVKACLWSTDDSKAAVSWKTQPRKGDNSHNSIIVASYMTCRQLNHLESLIHSKFYCLYNLGQGLCKSRNFRSFLNLSSGLLLKLLSFILLSGFWFLFFFALALMAQYILDVTVFHLEEILPSSSLYIIPNLSSMILFDSWQKWYRCLIFFSSSLVNVGRV